MRAGWQQLRRMPTTRRLRPGTRSVTDSVWAPPWVRFGGLSPALSLPSKGDNPLWPDNAIPQRLVQLANQLNEQFLPAKGLDLRLADLDKLRELNQMRLRIRSCSLTNDP